MQATELTIFCLISFLFLCVGFTIGWLIRENIIVRSNRKIDPLHPEFFNDDGTVNAGEVLSLHIEPNFYSEFISDYEDLFDDDDED